MLTHRLYALYFGKCKHGYCSKTCSDKKVNNIKQTQANEVHSSSIFIFKVSFASNFLRLRNKEQYTKEAFYFPKVIPWTILM